MRWTIMEMDGSGTLYHYQMVFICYAAGRALYAA